jgi:hypothetical protein
LDEPRCRGPQYPADRLAGIGGSELIWSCVARVPNGCPTHPFASPVAAPFADGTASASRSDTRLRFAASRLKLSVFLRQSGRNKFYGFPCEPTIAVVSRGLRHHHCSSYDPRRSWCALEGDEPFDRAPPPVKPYYQYGPPREGGRRRQCRVTRETRFIAETRFMAEPVHAQQRRSEMSRRAQLSRRGTTDTRARFRLGALRTDVPGPGSLLLRRTGSGPVSVKRMGGFAGAN